MELLRTAAEMRHAINAVLAEIESRAAFVTNFDSAVENLDSAPSPASTDLTVDQGIREYQDSRLHLWKVNVPDIFKEP